jgi:hypothetical protein
MDLTHPTPSKAAISAPPVPQPENALRSDVRGDGRGDVRVDARADARREVRNAGQSNVAVAPKLWGYGLPCAHCHLYYPANLDSCPTCNSEERVPPAVARAIAPNAGAQPEPDAAILEQERQAFLKQFKSQLFAADAEIRTAPAVCSIGDHSQPEAASICKPCYDQLQERVDVLEAALHIDLKEAAQIVYDAVWADPSDPSKTYANAASALLTELRKRSGVSSLLGPFQPLGN